MAASMPKKGRVAVPGLVGVTPGRGVIIMPAGFGLPPGIDDKACLWPMTWVIPDPGLGIDGPTSTVPSRRRVERSCASGNGRWPARMKARMAVGPV